MDHHHYNLILKIKYFIHLSYTLHSIYEGNLFKNDLMCTINNNEM